VGATRIQSLLLLLLLLLSLGLSHSGLLLQSLAHLLQRDDVRLLLLECHLVLLVQDALLDDCIDLLDRRARVVRQQDLLLPLNPLLLLLAQILHLLELLEALLYFFVSTRLFGAFRARLALVTSDGAARFRGHCCHLSVTRHCASSLRRYRRILCLLLRELVVRTLLLLRVCRGLSRHGGRVSLCLHQVLLLLRLRHHVVLGVVCTRHKLLLHLLGLL